jgi:hypothetical protein
LFFSLVVVLVVLVIQWLTAAMPTLRDVNRRSGDA